MVVPQSNTAPAQSENHPVDVSDMDTWEVVIAVTPVRY